MCKIIWYVSLKKMSQIGTQAVCNIDKRIRRTTSKFSNMDQCGPFMKYQILIKQ